MRSGQILLLPQPAAREGTRKINNEILQRGLRFWGRVRLGRAAERPGSPWPVRSALDRLDLAASSALCRPTWSFCRSNLLVRTFSGHLGPRFSSPKRLFFRSFCVPRTFDVLNVQHRKNIVKTSTKRTSELLCIEPKSIKNRSAWTPKSIQQRERT